MKNNQEKLWEKPLLMGCFVAVLVFAVEQLVAYADLKLYNIKNGPTPIESIITLFAVTSTVLAFYFSKMLAKERTRVVLEKAKIIALTRFMESENVTIEKFESFIIEDAKRIKEELEKEVEGEKVDESTSNK